MIYLSDRRLGEIIRACNTALARSDLHPGVRTYIARILASAQRRARLMFMEF